jgi:hypothetical protein
MPRQIYLTRELAEAISKFESKLYHLTVDFMAKVERGEDTEAWSAIADTVRSETPPLFKALEDQFRCLLGNTL